MCHFDLFVRVRLRCEAALLAIASLALLGLGAHAGAEPICTSFEVVPSVPTGICPNETVLQTAPIGDFAIGTSPNRAEFLDGNVMRVGIPAYYHSGLRSWHVGPGVTATIFFETPAAAIELFFRDTAGGGPSVVRVVNTDDVAILTSGPGNQFFQQVGVNNLPPGSALIDRIEVENNSALADVVVDDVAFVPEPAGQLFFATALLALLAARRPRTVARR